MTGSKTERGNIMFFILIAIVLIGTVTIALRNSGLENSGIDREGNIIKVAQMRQYTTELERALAYVMQNRISETEISFAHPDAPSDYGTYNTNPRAEIFHPQGGGANWRPAPAGVNDGSGWEFYATSAVPGVGSERADLIAVLPFMTPAACAEINRINNQTDEPEDTGTCFYPGGAAGRFSGSYSDSSPNEMDANVEDGINFTTIPATQACVRCATDYHFYHVLMAR